VKGEKNPEGERKWRGMQHTHYGMGKPFTVDEGGPTSVVRTPQKITPL